MYPRIQRQAGNLYIVAIFVILVIGYLATTLIRMEWSNQDTLSREVLGTKAWFAAHSINELALTRLYPLGLPDAVSTVCENQWDQVVSAANSLMSGYPGCVAVTSCTKLPGDLNGHRLFKVESQVSCGTGIHQVARAQEMLVKE